MRRQAFDIPPIMVQVPFTATAPNQLWVTDFTYVATFVGTVYVAFVLDVFSRMIVGWRAANRMRTDLPLVALEMALWHRGRAGHDARHTVLVMADLAVCAVAAAHLKDCTRHPSTATAQPRPAATRRARHDPVSLTIPQIKRLLADAVEGSVASVDCGSGWSGEALNWPASGAGVAVGVCGFPVSRRGDHGGGALVYPRYGLSYRDVEELLAERGVQVDHVTVYRWVQRFTPLFTDAARFARHSPG